VTTSQIHRTVRVTVLSAFLALAVFSFVAFGSGSAHAMTRQAASTGTTTFVSIVSQQRFFVFSPSAITVKSGASIRITNRTAFELEVRTMSPQTFYNLAPGAGLTITPTQSEVVRVCGGYGGELTITVV
jgi:plastocyanin